MSKVELRDQAKGLLLKGCYKMAYNKYCRLIEMGSQGFTKREWAVVHLNQGICLQFQQQFQKSIQSINRSIEIDPTYEKAYYRRLQILREMGNFQTAINSIPIWIKNKQVEGLLQEIKEEYLNSMGMDQILEDLAGKKTHTFEFVKESHAKFYQKIVEALESGCSCQHLQKVGSKICSYYKHLKEEKQSDVLESFLSKLHFLLIKQRDSKDQSAYNSLLASFWTQFTVRSDSFSCQDFTLADLKTKEEFKITKYAPISKEALHFLMRLIQHSSLQDEHMFQFTLQLTNNLCLYAKEIEYSKKVGQITQNFIQNLNNDFSAKHLGWLKRSFILVDNLIKLHLLLEPTIAFDSMDTTTLFYLHYHLINNPSQNFTLENTPFQKIKMLDILDFFQNNIESFLVIYTFQHIVHRLDRSLLKELIPIIEQQLQVLKELRQISKSKEKVANCKQLQLQKQQELVYTSILLKIDLKHNSNKISIDSIMRRNNKPKDQSALSDLQINTLLLLAISSKQNLLQILHHQQSITEVVTQFIHHSFLQQIESIKIVTSFIYMLVIDLQADQEENFAKKMGTSVEDIRKAKKIQGEKEDQLVNKQLKEKQEALKAYISKNWQDIIPSYCDLIVKIKDESSLVKWGRIVSQIGKIDHSRFHNPKVISAMLECFKYQKKDVGQLFSILCKKINIDLIKYQYLQSIANVLIHNVQKSDEELVIFESLLGLINFTSNSSNKVRIPIKTIINSVFQENKYIVHAACSLLNNLFVYQQAQEMNKQVRLKDIVDKYIAYYRGQIENDEGIPLSDYAHPSRVYSTLLSLAMVLDLQSIYEFQEWPHLESCLLKIKTSRSEILYKSVWYMSMKNKLKGKWWPPFQRDLAQLKTQDQQRWLKLQQYIKR